MRKLGYILVLIKAGTLLTRPMHASTLATHELTTLLKKATRGKTSGLEVLIAATQSQLMEHTQLFVHGNTITAAGSI